MYNKLTIISLFITSWFITTITRTEAPQQPQEIPKVTIAPVFNNTPNISPEYKLKNNPNFTNHVFNSIAITLSTYLTNLYQQATKKDYKNLTQLIKKALWNYRYRIIMGTTALVYCATNILLLADYNYINNNTTWSHWKHEYTFEDLCTQPQKQLTHELLLAIGQHYYNEKNLTDRNHPLIQFLHTIDTEIRVIKRYIRTVDIIKQSHLIKIFPANDHKAAHAQKLLDRALFIRHLFLSWISEYNLAHNG